MRVTLRASSSRSCASVMALSIFVPEINREKMEEQIKDNSEMLKQMASHGVKIETVVIFYEFDDS